MREAAMVSELIDRSFESGQDIEIRRFGGERHGRRGERGLAVESCPRQNGSGQEVCEWFQRKVLTRKSREQ